MTTNKQDIKFKKIFELGLYPTEKGLLPAVKLANEHPTGISPESLAAMNICVFNQAIGYCQNPQKEDFEKRFIDAFKNMWEAKEKYSIKVEDLNAKE